MNGTLVEATWFGGPFDGTTMNVISGVKFFPLYATVPVADAREGQAHPTWLCPVVEGPDGRLFIDWNHRIRWPAPDW